MYIDPTNCEAPRCSLIPKSTPLSFVLVSTKKQGRHGNEANLGGHLALTKIHSLLVSSVPWLPIRFMHFIQIHGG